MNESFIKISRMCLKSQADQGLELQNALVLPMRVEGATSQLDLPSLTPLSDHCCGRLQLGVPQLGYFVDYSKQLIIDPTFCGSRFSTGRLLAIEDFTVIYQQMHANDYLEQDLLKIDHCFITRNNTEVKMNEICNHTTPDLYVLFSLFFFFLHLATELFQIQSLSKSIRITCLHIRFLDNTGTLRLHIRFLDTIRTPHPHIRFLDTIRTPHPHIRFLDTIRTPHPHIRFLGTIGRPHIHIRFLDNI